MTKIAKNLASINLFMLFIRNQASHIAEMRFLLGLVTLCMELCCFIKAEFIPVCTPILCRNKGNCVERPFQPEGFVCICADGYHGRTCDYRLPGVECLSDRIVLKVDKGLIAEEANFIDQRMVYLGKGYFDDSDCVSMDLNDHLVVQLESPFQKCGTDSRSNGASVVYRNRLYLDTALSPFANNSHRMVLLDWSCVYSSKYMVSFPFGIQPAVNKPESRVAFGQFTVNMGVFLRSDYLPESELKPPAALSSGQRIFAQVELLTSSSSDLVVTYKSCRATNTPLDGANGTAFAHELINRGCPSDRDPTVDIISSGNATTAKFSFRMFMWSGEKLPVYLHCVVSICNVTRFAEACTASCGDSSLSIARRRRSVADDANREPDLLLAVGPFIIQDDTVIPRTPVVVRTTDTTAKTESEARKMASVQTVHYVLGIFGALGLICFLLIGAVAYRRYWQNRGYDFKRHGSRATSLDDDVTEAPPAVQSISHSIQEVNVNGADESVWL